MEPYRRLVILGALSSLAAPALSQVPGKTHVVGFWGGDGYWDEPEKPPQPAPVDRRIEWFEDGLAKLGFVTGKNLEVAYVFTFPRSKGLVAQQALELMSKRPDVIHLSSSAAQGRRLVG